MFENRPNCHTRPIWIAKLMVYTNHSQCHYQAWLTGLLFWREFYQHCKFMTETMEPMECATWKAWSGIHPSDSETSLRPSKNVWAFG